MIVTKKVIPRRAVLRGVGTALALPLLDGMVPALTALTKTAAAPTKRLGVRRGAERHQHELLDAAVGGRWRGPTGDPLRFELHDRHPRTRDHADLEAAGAVSGADAGDDRPRQRRAAAAWPGEPAMNHSPPGGGVSDRRACEAHGRVGARARHLDGPDRSQCRGPGA